MTNVIQLKVLKLCCKNDTKHFKVVCIRFSQKVSKCKTEMALSFSPSKLTWISLSEQQPFVLLWATSASKIRCKAPLYVTVKGHWGRSITFAARLRCISGITLLHTIYRRITQTDSPNTHWVYCYLIDRGVCLVFCIFFFLLYKVKLRPHDRPSWTRSSSQSRSSVGCQAWNYNSQALDCNNMYSKVVHWVSMPLMHREKAATFKVRPEKTQKPSTSLTKKTSSILSMHIKVIVLLWYTVHQRIS